MSRLDELKKQYPELNITIMDVLKKLDSSNTYKYLPLICKIFTKKFKNESESFYSEFKIAEFLKEKGFSIDSLTINELLVCYHISDFFSIDHYQVFRTFIEYMEKNKLLKNDVTSYSSLDDMRSAITLSDLEEYEKSLEKQVIKEFEDNKWVIVRPLTFSSSAKYGSSTRWCTTYQNEKQYFERYWRTGILIYVINKQTGYKFAGFKSLEEKREISFWGADDIRLDLLEIDIDDYLYVQIKNIFKSDNTNKNLCSSELQEQVHQECLHEQNFEYMPDIPATVTQWDGPQQIAIV